MDKTDEIVFMQDDCYRHAPTRGMLVVCRLCLTGCTSA